MTAKIIYGLSVEFPSAVNAEAAQSEIAGLMEYFKNSVERMRRFGIDVKLVKAGTLEYSDKIEEIKLPAPAMKFWNL